MSRKEQGSRPNNLAGLRRKAGKWIQQRREACGMSQAELATLVGADYYSLISQVENGRGRIPVHKYRDWAQALNMDHREFVKKILEFYDPLVHEILFEENR